MCAGWMLLLTPKKGKSNASLDVGMPIDTRSNTLSNPLTFMQLDAMGKELQ